MPAPHARSTAVARDTGGIARSTRVLAASIVLGVSSIGLGASLMRQGTTISASDAPSLEHRSRIDPNTADAARLTLLPRIGPVLAERIVQDRDEHGPFQSASDLQRVRGIGPKTVERIAPMLDFEADPPAGDPRRSPAEP